MSIHTGIDFQREAVRPAYALANSVGEDDDESIWSPVTLLLAAVGTLVFAVMLMNGSNSWVAAGMLGLFLGVLAVLNARAGVIMTFVLLAVLGDARRLISLGMPAGSDPMVLVAPFIVLILTVKALLQDRLTTNTPISRQLFIVLVIMSLQAFNPLQGGPMVGLMGIVCIILPMCWFWIGQSCGSARFVEILLYRVVLPLAIAAGCFALVQVFWGRPSYQDAWLRLRWGGEFQEGGDAQRPFAFFSSVGEFATYLAIGMVLSTSSLISGRIRVLLLGLPVIATALFLSSVRGSVVKACGTTILMWALLGTTNAGRVARGIAAAVLIVGGMYWTLGQVNDMEVDATREFIVRHQTEGLLDPFGDKSTATGHASAGLLAIPLTFRNPIGLGLGTATHVAGAYGGPVAALEIDISNMFVALGVVGGLAYMVLYYKVLREAYLCWNKTRAFPVLVLLGVILTVFGHWINTGDYSTISLVWFCIGALDRLSSRAPALPAAAGRTP